MVGGIEGLGKPEVSCTFRIMGFRRWNRLRILINIIIDMHMTRDVIQ